MFDTDVLLLDEVLSVGDASFRRKSFEWMRNFSRQDKTVILVSHNLSEVENFCDRVIYVDGELKLDSTNIRSVIMQYMIDYPEEPKVIDPNWLMVDSQNNESGSTGNLVSVGPDIEINSITLTDSTDELKTSFMYDDEIRINLSYMKKQTGVSISFIWKVFDMNDVLVLASSPMFSPSYNPVFTDETGQITQQTIIPPLFLNQGRYYLTLVCGVDNEVKGTLHRQMMFDVYQNDWVQKEAWANISSAILHNFPTRISKKK
jgi:hypothetical protein